MLNSAGLCVTADRGETVQNVDIRTLRRKSVIMYNLLLAGRLEAEHWVSRMAKWQLMTLDTHKEHLSFLAFCSPLPSWAPCAWFPLPGAKHATLPLFGVTFWNISLLLGPFPFSTCLLHSTENWLCPENWDEHWGYKIHAVLESAWWGPLSHFIMVVHSQHGTGILGVQIGYLT